MTERIDHAAQAVGLEQAAWQKGVPDGDALIRTHEQRQDMILSAQVHATLALVEQQRIANLIALSAWQEFGPNDGKIRIPSYTQDGTLRDDIREALGL